MLRIVIDFDSTLFQTIEHALDVYNKRHDTSIELSQITTYNLYESLPTEVADELFELFIDKDLYDSLQPYKGAVRTVRTLIEQGHEIYVATASDMRNMEWKEQLLQKHFPFIPKNNLIRIHNKALLDVDVMIEDNIDNLTQTFADRVCFNQLWNQSDEKDFAYSIYRIHHWGELNNVINEIERKNKEWEK
jgi:5'(3')-deoxyribonucleotidase